MIFRTIFQARAGSSDVMSAPAGAGRLPTACNARLSWGQIQSR
ncbi:hypothetical protein BF49_4378 [Bradyrhizobium sp.]|nr:hypothetical protein BF49_4378 [Bradyrhizobium sp.]